MKKLTILILLVFLSGCASFSPKPSYDLESRMEALEKQIKKIELMAVSGAAAATDRVWPFYGLTGGGNALDGIVEGSIGANDFALGRDSSGFGYLYYWDATDANAQSVPSIIKPDPTDNTGSWLSIARWYASAFYSTAADGEHLMDPSNSSAFPAAPAEGSITCRDDYDACFVYDGSSWLPLLTGNYGAYIATGTISILHSWGGTVSNEGASGNIVLTLQDCVDPTTLLMEVTIACADNSGDIQVIPLAGDSIFDTGGTIDLNCAPLTTDPAAVTVKCVSSTTWVVTGDAGTVSY